jgi:hypothetical protein
MATLGRRVSGEYRASIGRVSGEYRASIGRVSGEYRASIGPRPYESWVSPYVITAVEWRLANIG